MTCARGAIPQTQTAPEHLEIVEKSFWLYQNGTPEHEKLVFFWNT